MRCVVVRSGGRLLLRLNEKTLLDPPPGMKGVLAGALVEVESRYEAGRGMVVTRLEEVLAPGGGTPIAEARAYRDRGLLAEARAIVGEGPLSDPAALATRALLKLDAGESAASDLRALLESGEGDATEPWDVASLFVAASDEALKPALASWLAKTKLPPGSPAVQRVLEIAPPTAWTPEQLFARLARAGDSQREVLASAVAEARARGIEGPALAVAEEALASVVAAADAKASTKRTHVVLQAALRAAHKRVRPPPPYHLGGPAPILTLDDLRETATFCAEAVRDLVATPQRASYDRALEALRELHEYGPPDAVFADLDLAEGLPVTAAVVHARDAQVQDETYHVLSAAKSAATVTVKLLQDAKRAEDATAFLRNLDAFLVDCEWRALVAAHSDGAPTVAHVLWRGDDGKKKLGHVLVRTTDGGLAHLSKTARRWRWHTGSRDDVLATIPDAHFAEAARLAS